MSEIKVNFIFNNQRTELNFTQNELIQNILSSFATKINRKIEEFNFLYSGEKLSNYENKTLFDLNPTDKDIKISVYEKNKSLENSEEKIMPENMRLKVSDHIICPRCKFMSEIDIKNFKVYVTNCNNNHSMPGLYMNDFITTQYIDESRIICQECKKSQKEFLLPDEINSNQLLMCSCGTPICQSCFQIHKDKSSNKNHNSIPYKNKDYFCFEHNIIYSAYCQNCRKNICIKCEDAHNKHQIDLFKKIVPKDDYILQIKKMNEELISKVKKFNNELNELINLLNNISTNIQNDLKIFLQIANKVINDYNLDKKNHQVIQNMKVIHNTLNESPILKNIDTFLADNNSANRIKCMLDMYNTMYLESSNINIDQGFNLNKINSDEINIKEDKKIIENNEKTALKIKKEYENFMELKYISNIKCIKQNRIKLFGNTFCENNKDNCLFVINEKEYPLSVYYTLTKNDMKVSELEVKLIQINPLTDMSYMFHSEEDDPIFLSEITSNTRWDTSKVKDMSNLFYNCNSLKTIQGISYWDTSSLTKTSNLFSNCINLTSIDDISKWKMDKVIDMSNMFYNCKNIISLPDVSNWNTKNVKDMRNIFCNCSSLKSLQDISKWNTENVINMTGLFRNCKNLEKLPDISNWVVDNVVYMGGIFANCISLQSLPDISKWNIKNVTNINHILYHCINLNSLPDISSWNTSNVNNMKGLFCDCSSLSVLPDISKWNTSNISDMSYMFYNCSSLLSLPDLLEWNTNKIENIKFMFTNCKKLPEQIIPKKFKT